jgi:hypothetical protein
VSPVVSPALLSSSVFRPLGFGRFLVVHWNFRLSFLLNKLSYFTKQAAKMLAVLFNKNKLGEDTPHAVLNWRLWYGVFGKLFRENVLFDELV